MKLLLASSKQDDFYDRWRRGFVRISSDAFGVFYYRIIEFFKFLGTTKSNVAHAWAVDLYDQRYVKA